MVVCGLVCKVEIVLSMLMPSVMRELVYIRPLCNIGIHLVALLIKLMPRY